MTFGAVTGVVCFAAFAIVHLRLPRVMTGLQRGALTFKLVPVFVAVIAIVITARAFAGLDGGSVATARLMVAVIWGEFAFLGLFVLYMPFIYTLSHSLSVETLLLLTSRDDGRIREEQLTQKFTSPAFLDARLTSMVESGYLAVKDSRYRLTRRGRTVARGFDWLKSLWRLGSGG